MNGYGLALAAPGSWERSQQHGASSGDHDQHQIWPTLTTWPRYGRLEEQSLFPSWRVFEERVRTGPFGLTSFPSEPYSPIRVLVIRGRVSPNLQQFIRTNTPPRLRSEWLMSVPQHPQEASLTSKEFNKAMKKLKKQNYMPNPPRSSRKRGLFSSWNSSNEMSKDSKSVEKEVKDCAICLETFILNEEVLVTPCNHIFHNDCLVPWVKSHGKCPVCRFDFCDKRETMTTPNNGVFNDGEVALQLMSLISAMEEAFGWASHR